MKVITIETATIPKPRESTRLVLIEDFEEDFLSIKYCSEYESLFRAVF